MAKKKSATTGVSRPADHALSLGELAARKGLLFGSGVESGEFSKPRGPAYARLLKTECRIITTGTEIKLHAVRPTPQVITYDGADSILRFASANDLQLRGHTLIWNDYLPDWIKKLSARDAASILERHIWLTMDRYRGKFHSYDVVNEPIAPWDKQPGDLRAGAFLSALGKDYIARSFRIARGVDAKAKLVLNEAQMEAQTARGLRFRKSFMNLLRDLKDQDVPIDAIGFQGHLTAGTSYDFDKFARYLESVAALGYEIYITEMDVNDLGWRSQSITGRDAKSAKLIYDFLTAVLSVKAVRVVQFWDLIDDMNWIYERHRRAHPKSRRLPRPCLYDGNLRRKPVWEAVRRALVDMPAR